MHRAEPIILRSLRLKHFKAFSSIRVPFEPFTMLVGPNGSGKSTVLQAIDLLGGLVRSSLNEYLGQEGWEYSDLPHLRSYNWVMELRARFKLGERSVCWQVDLGKRRFPGVAGELVEIPGDEEKPLLRRAGRTMARWDETPERHQETIVQSLNSSWLSALDETDKEDARRFPTLLSLARWARGVHGFFFLDPLKLRASGRGKPEDIGRHGEALAPFLGRLRSSNQAAWKRLIRRVKRHYPRLVDLHPKRVQGGWTELEVVEHLRDGEALFNARQVSDGLLRLIAVSALHELPRPPSVMLIDEVENGLHPHLMGGFIEMLQDLVEERQGATQVIVTTHSPIAVNSCRVPSSVVVMGRSRKGEPRVMRLDEAKSFQELRQHFDLGELWYNVGEPRILQ